MQHPRFTTPPQHEVYRHAKAGDIAKVRYWLEDQNFPIDKTDFYSNTVLYYGCLCNHPPLVAYLMERGATFIQKSTDGRRTFLASSNQVIRHLLQGKPIGEEGSKLPMYVEQWYTGALKSTTLSDITFIVQGKEIPAHKSIVAARCPNLIPKLEAQSSITMGAAITELTFSTFLTYLYTDEVDDKVAKELSKTLGAMSKKLGVQGLADFCEDPKKEIDPIYSMQRTMKGFVNSPQFSDITLITADGAAIHAHKIILTTRCDYFKALLSLQWTDQDAKELGIDDISKEALEIVLQYIYSGTYEVNANNIWDVLAAAGKFLLPRLQQELEFDIVKNYLDVDSCIELATASDMLCFAKVYKASVRVIVNNFKTLSETKAFLDLPPNIQADVVGILHPSKKKDMSRKPAA